MLTNSETQTEGHISDSVDRTVDGGVTDIDEIAQLGHHRRVNHANGKTQSSVWQNQISDVGREWNLLSQLKSIKIKVKVHQKNY